MCCAVAACDGLPRLLQDFADAGLPARDGGAAPVADDFTVAAPAQRIARRDADKRVPCACCDTHAEDLHPNVTPGLE